MCVCVGVCACVGQLLLSHWKTSNLKRQCCCPAPNKRDIGISSTLYTHITKKGCTHTHTNIQAHTYAKTHTQTHAHTHRHRHTHRHTNAHTQAHSHPHISRPTHTQRQTHKATKLQLPSVAKEGYNKKFPLVSLEQETERARVRERERESQSWACGFVLLSSRGKAPHVPLCPT